MNASALPAHRTACVGELPLTARLEPWQEAVLGEPDALRQLLGEGDAPVNLIDPGPIERNGAELIDAARAHDIDLKIFFARKANKCLSLVERARDLGYGVDVASRLELEEVLESGFDGRRVVVTAAVKPRALIELAIGSGATIVVDNSDELGLIKDLAGELGRDAVLAIRLAVELAGRTPTRFGVDPSQALEMARLIEPDDRIRLVGLHFHLDGYSAPERAEALAAALPIIEGCQFDDSAPAFIDIGGGVPMSYLEDGDQWAAFWEAHQEALAGSREPLTFEGHGLGLTHIEGRIHGNPSVYPYHQRPIRGEWLGGLLATRIEAPGGSATVGAALSSRGLELRCEPGRALLDGCGMTAALVHFVKRRADGTDLIGLGMNRTQCRSTSDDFMVDPLLIRSDDTSIGDPREGFLVGAYCIERELITLRRLRFPSGVASGDIIVLPNTAGYLMHILESSSHRMPLADNYVHREGVFELDPVSRGPQP